MCFQSEISCFKTEVSVFHILLLFCKKDQPKLRVVILRFFATETSEVPNQYEVSNEVWVKWNPKKNSKLRVKKVSVCIGKSCATKKICVNSQLAWNFLFLCTIFLSQRINFPNSKVLIFHGK
jgi:hypothetical protein